MAAEYYSDWGYTNSSRHESETQDFVVSWHVSGNVVSNSNLRMPGGYLAWVIRKSGGESHIHACRVHQTVEASIVETANPTETSQVDSYVPPTKMLSLNGHFPFAPSVSVLIDNYKNPNILGLSSGITMFASDKFRIEEKKLPIDLYDRPTRITAKKFRGKNLIGICSKMLNGNVAFILTDQIADLSSSSSSLSSLSSISSVSSLSSSSLSSSSSTQRLTSSYSSLSTSSSSSTVRFTSSLSSSQSRTSLSSLSSETSDTSISSASSMSWDCDWGAAEVLDETFYDMDGNLGGVGTVRNEFLNWNITNLNLSNTDLCNKLWCIYVPQGTFGVGGSAIGQVYFYKLSTRPSAPPYSNSVMVGGFTLDSSGIMPKTITITDRGTGSGIGGTVLWLGGYGHGPLLPGCSAYRLQIPFILRNQDSSSSSISSMSSPSSSSSSSSQSLCLSEYTKCAFMSGWDPCSWLSIPPGGTDIAQFYMSITKSEFPDCQILGEISTSISTIGLTSYYILNVHVWSGGIARALGTVTWKTYTTGIGYTVLFTNGWVDIVGTGTWISRGTIGRIYMIIGTGPSTGSHGFFKLYN